MLATLLVSVAVLLPHHRGGEAKCVDEEQQITSLHSSFLDLSTSNNNNASFNQSGALTLGSLGGACMNGGVCRNGTCLCKDGWQGSECQFCGGKVR